MRTDVTAIVDPEARAESAEVAPAPRARAKTRWVILALLLAAWAGGVLWRLWLGHPIVTPIGHADEDSYLNAARAIGGGPAGFSSETPSSVTSSTLTDWPVLAAVRTAFCSTTGWARFTNSRTFSFRMSGANGAVSLP